ncbi:hypothetical protein [Granulicella sp. L60]|uniref:hypothetical protein n=1 Tax=Granulicella sp. L60 TaxID=1641866 RepID=UPI00131EB617|nr:hypothetical protein [Granulicella sp. L60]
MSAEMGLGRVVAALVGAVVSFCVVGGAVFYKVAGVGVSGLRHGGPVVLAGAMAGLFGGGLVAMLMLITALRWGRKGGRE